MEIQINENEENEQEEEKTSLSEKKPTAPTQSKKQIKKLKRKQKWEEKKKEKKIKLKEKKLLAKANPESQPKKLQENDHSIIKKRFNKTEKQEYKVALQNSHPIIIDCSFQPLMTEKEIKSLCLQFAYCHSANRKFPIRSQIVFTSFKDQIKQKMLKTNADSWGVMLEEKHYLDCYDKNKLVYLTGDAEEELNEIEAEYDLIFNHINNHFSKIYIIGGMVDHNRLKLATYNKAKEEGLAMKKFPISAFVKLKSSTHLTVNHGINLNS